MATVKEHLEAWSSEYRNAEVHTPPVELPDAVYTGEVCGGRTNSGEMLVVTFVLKVLVGDERGNTTERTHFVKDEDSLSRLKDDMFLLGSTENDFTKFESEFEKIINARPVVEFQTKHNPSKDGSRTFYNVYIQKQVKSPKYGDVADDKKLPF